MPSAPEPPVRLDLRGTPCPLNYVRSKLALERLELGACLQLDLDRGEPEQMVTEGLRGQGHAVEVQPHPQDPAAVRIRVVRHG